MKSKQKALGFGSGVDFLAVRIPIAEVDKDTVFLIRPVDANGGLVGSFNIHKHVICGWIRAPESALAFGLRKLYSLFVE